MNNPPLISNVSGTEKAVCEDIAKRQALGVKKYGTTVSQNPLELKQWLQHQYEELLDAAVYAKRAIEEIEKKAVAAAAPVGTLEEQVFRKFPLCSTFIYLGVKMVVIEQRKKRPEIPGFNFAMLIVPSTPEVKSALICHHSEGGKLITTSFPEGIYSYLLSECKSQ